MDIVRMEGGLGNQLFQYALYRELQFLGRDVKMDVTTEYGREQDRPHMLWALQAVYEEASQEEINRLTDGFVDFFSRVRRKLTGRRTKLYAEKDSNFDPEVLRRTPVYLTGYFQSRRYFKDVEEQLRKELVFADEIYRGVSAKLRQTIECYQRQIDSCESVALHVRRGDYLQNPEIYGKSCTDAYYQTAVSYMKTHCTAVRFFVFTNDAEWTKDWLLRSFGEEEQQRFTLVEGTTEENGYLDLMLMSRCKHQIMANSSFSWWGAWLNAYKDKLVTAPSPWFGDRKLQDIYTEDMILITASGEVCPNE